MEADDKPPKKKSWGRRLLVCLLAVVLLIIAAELVGRFAFGLGNPPQSIPDDDVEYRLKPSSDYRRIGNSIKHNRYSMRSDDFPQHKASPDEFRVMVLGDSIVNGGSQLDQDELATEQLRDRLQAELKRPVVVGNVAAASWGPPNLLAYVRKFGLFDADVVLIVVNNSDAWDVPAPIDERGECERVPRFALEELAMLSFKDFGLAEEMLFEFKQAPPEHVALAVNALQQLVDDCRQRGADVALVLHYQQGELDWHAGGLSLFEKVAQEREIPHFSTKQAYRAARLQSEIEIFRDGVHLTARGQQVLADVLFEAVNELIDAEGEE